MKSFVVGILTVAVVLVGSAGSPLGPATLAGELAGVTLPDTLKVADKTLKLNGLGLRKRAVFKVYVGGLYLESPSKDVGAILASDQAKAIRMHFVRDLRKAQLFVEAFHEGFEANVKDRAPQKAAFDWMLALVPDVKEGSTLTFAYVPGKGTTLSAGGMELGVFEGTVVEPIRAWPWNLVSMTTHWHYALLGLFLTASDAGELVARRAPHGGGSGAELAPHGDLRSHHAIDARRVAEPMTLAPYVIVDLEFPRLGFIRLDAYDQLLVDVRESMR
jgi:chalcone isomerase-like protein